MFAAAAALADAAELPGVGDDETTFGPGRAFVRRVSGRNGWILYRFDDDHMFAFDYRPGTSRAWGLNVFVMTARWEPPVPADE